MNKNNWGFQKQYLYRITSIPNIIGSYVVLTEESYVWILDVRKLKGRKTLHGYLLY